MTFLNPLGLLGLLAIPVLVFIYIIKSKYTEQTITSTYLWMLSERFLKRKNPINKLTGIISLILQILAVVFISIALAHPSFVLKGRAADYCFVLDGSGSMNIVQGGSTRFDIGKDYIRRVISSAADGSTYTLVTTGNTTDTVLKSSEDKKSALRQLDALTPAQVAADFENARQVAQEYFNANPSCRFYVITDKDIGSLENIELVNVGTSVNNYALDGVGYTFDVDGNVSVGGKAFSYESDAEITIELFADDGRTSVASTQVALARGVGADFKIDWTAAAGQTLPEFRSLRVAIRQRDALGLDNQVILYNMRGDSSYNTLIVSDTPFFVEAGLASLSGIKREVISPKEYNEGMRGYGLYVFQNYTPEKMPTDGAVWFINPDTGVDGSSGFSVRGPEKFDNPVKLDMSTSSASRVRNILNGTVKSTSDYVSPSVVNYVKCGLIRSFSTIMSCNNDPVVFVGSNTYGNREVVFAFDFVETSNFSLTYNGRVIMRNLLEYTFPSLVNETSLYCGEALSVNVLAHCSSIRLESPSGKAEYLDISETSIDYQLTEVGEYTITATVGNNQQTVKVFSQLPVAERIVSATEASFWISGTAETHKRDGKYEDLLYAFIILAVIVVADWMVYCYEQYQLR